MSLDFLQRDPPWLLFLWAMTEFSVFIDSCNLMDPPLEGTHFTWFTHAKVFVLYRVDRFFFFLIGKITS